MGQAALSLMRHALSGVTSMLDAGCLAGPEALLTRVRLHDAELLLASGCVDTTAAAQVVHDLHALWQGGAAPSLPPLSPPQPLPLPAHHSICV